MLQLKQSQVDYEAMKLENYRLKDDLEEMQNVLEEMARLKDIFENNFKETLQALQQERELKHSLKKELDQRVKAQSMFSLQNFAQGQRSHDSLGARVLKKVIKQFFSYNSKRKHCLWSFQKYLCKWYKHGVGNNRGITLLLS